MDERLSAAQIREAGWPAERLEQALRRHAQDKPDAIAVVGPNATLTFAEVDLAADKVAAIIGATGGPGAQVAWLGPNDTGYTMTLVGAWRARGGLVGLNWRLPDDDIAASCAEVGVTHIFCSESFADRARGIAGDIIHVEVVDQSTSTPWPDVEPAATLEPEFDDPGMVFFTSGSTGVPKAVPLDRLAVEIGAATPVVHRFDAESRLLIIPPVFHLAGAYWAQYGLLYGAQQVYLAVPTPENMVNAFADHEITHAVLVPTLIRAVVDQMQATGIRLPKFRHLAYGASAITIALLKEAMEVFQSEFTQVFGMTEAGGVVSYLPPEDHVLDGPNAHRLASAGRCTVGVELEVRDPETRAVLGPDESGELWFRTPFMAQGYINRPEQSAAIFVDGWLNTRDMGRVDADGYIYVEGRSDDMIITGGENVHPGEVEGVLAELSDVVEVAVFGVPDPLWGRRVAAAVVSRTGELTEELIVAHARVSLAGYKIPRLVYFLTELPKTASGKVTRSGLVDLLAPKEDA
ncbi:MAG: AMP-binding protein [Phycicoccus sp.]|nr:AMP-binding protein [Phycicoccus sp.]